MKKTTTSLVGALALASACAATAQTAPWYPSKFGAKDEIGAANYLTPAVALKAAQLVKTGKVHSLGITVNTTTPAFPPRTCSIYIVQPGQVGAATGLGNTNTTYNDDFLNCWTGIGTQLDGLGHIGVGDRYYNGMKWADIATIGGMKKLGVEIRQGDVVIFHTGWLSLIEKDAKRYGSVEPGLGRKGARHLVSKGVVAIGADTWALEAIPFEKKGAEDGGVFEVHQILLPMSGTYILENINTAELAKDKAWEFMFVLGQNKYQGSVQSMINPIAIR
jgi:hypothetical protein